MEEIFIRNDDSRKDWKMFVIDEWKEGRGFDEGTSRK